MISFVLISFYSVFAFLHEYHVSIAEIRFNEENQHAEISIKLFIDDFEKAMNISGNKIRVKDDLSETAVRQSLENYLGNHFNVRVNDTTLVMKYLGAKWDEDLHSFFVFLESPIGKEVRSVEIFNNIFVEVSEQQENIHYLQINDLKRTIVLNKYKTAEAFEISR